MIQSVSAVSVTSHLAPTSKGNDTKAAAEQVDAAKMQADSGTPPADGIIDVGDLQAVLSTSATCPMASLMSAIRRSARRNYRRRRSAGWSGSLYFGWRRYIRSLATAIRRDATPGI